jgi:hypothetical protein
MFAELISGQIKGKETVGARITKIRNKECPILMKHEFSEQILVKNSNMKFHETPSSRNTVVPGVQTDEQT